MGNPDGMKVDEKGNIYSVGVGGIWVISPAGKHLATIIPPEGGPGVGFGDADRKTLYIAGNTTLYRIRLKIPGR
jgi:gluconolactonase